MPGGNVSSVCRHPENWTNGKRYTPFSHWSGLPVLTVILHTVSSRTESWGYKKGENKKPLLAEGLRCTQNQHEYWGLWSNSTALCELRKGSALHPPFGTPTAGPLWLQPARKALDIHHKFTESKQPRVNGLWWTSLANKETRGRLKSCRFWSTTWAWNVRRGGTQEPTSASEHSQDVGRFSDSAQQSQKRQWGQSCLFVTWLQEEFKPHRHCTGLEDMAQSHDFTSTPGTAACEHVIAEGTVI